LRNLFLVWTEGSRCRTDESLPDRPSGFWPGSSGFSLHRSQSSYRLDADYSCLPEKITFYYYKIPTELDVYDLHVDESDPAWSIWALWHRVEVIESSPAKDINGGGAISIKLQNSHQFIEPTPGMK
jgi:hypothetical protein